MFSILNEAWEVEGLTPAEKLVLVRLADRADRTGLARPGQTSIARQCCLGVRTVRLCLDSLAKKGHLQIIRHHTPILPAIYKVTPIAPGKSQAPPAAIAGPRKSKGPPTPPAAIAGGREAKVAVPPPAAIAGGDQSRPAAIAGPSGSHCRPPPAAIAGKPSDNRQEPPLLASKMEGQEEMKQGSLLGDEETPSKKKPGKRAPNPQRDPIFNALMQVEGIEPGEVTTAKGNQIGKCINEILEATPDCDRDEVLRRAHAYRRRWPRVTLTALALSKHWASLGDGPAEDSGGGAQQFGSLEEAMRAGRGGDQ